MNKLYHYPICPLSRLVRILLKELNISFALSKEDLWSRRKEFLDINPANTLPVLEIDRLKIVGIYAIIEYLNEQYNYSNLLAQQNIEDRCEIRRLLSWCNEKFYHEVSNILIEEKVIKCFLTSQSPRTNFLRAAKLNLRDHFEYFSILLDKRSFLVGEVLTLADLSASAHISVADYFGECEWDKFPLVKQWYAILKSRPSFRYILQDTIPGYPASRTYVDLDF